MIEYRLYIDNTPASREQLDLVEDITVEQAVDMAWEARLQIPIGTDEQGQWNREAEELFAEFTPVRIELRVGDGAFSPLIDGPVVDIETQMQTEPRQSMVTIVVQDDSVFLNREDRIFRFDQLLDHQIAEELFGEVPQITTTDIATTPAPSSNSDISVVQRGTAMQLLRSLAQRQGMHAYVLPGETPGQSIGCFQPFSTEPGDLPPLTLMGPERNLDTFSPHDDLQRPARVTTYALSLLDKTVTQRTTDPGDLDRLGPNPALDEDTRPAAQILPPHYGDAVDLDQMAAAAAERASYASEVSGTVLGHYYRGILLPYQVVTVRGVDPGAAAPT
ncbi:hypothetical protein XM38_039880 [Halomicronema hongdechloris C2206]|uniref:Uncharacterized protein n=1 Tax=Halomicronema hongdechloris C2206 TaxID=1641165 RepID=A0A1Z3HRX7_9CYAN|nr:hypothetical protein [Halomicronema hongdechloris]ASC73026.1 hypothetical protein XM38_039880 [Halomicronema hongdechloris C2206]